MTKRTQNGPTADLGTHIEPCPGAGCTHEWAWRRAAA